MTVTTKARVRWTAARDGVAHAHRAGNAPRTLCDLPAIETRLAWPEQRRCLGCEVLVAELEGRLA